MDIIKMVSSCFPFANRKRPAFPVHPRTWGKTWTLSPRAEQGLWSTTGAAASIKVEWFQRSNFEVELHEFSAKQAPETTKHQQKQPEQEQERREETQISIMLTTTTAAATRPRSRLTLRARGMKKRKDFHY